MQKGQIRHIIAKNTFTLFNLVNLILVLMVIFVGSYKNALFILIAIANTLISIINEIRAYKIVSKMRLISEQKPTIIRDGKPQQVPSTAVEKGDIIILSLGDQIPFDSEIIEGSLEVNESLITGEQDNIAKNIGEPLTSGSFVVSGTAKAKVQHIGADNFVNQLEKDAKNIKTADSQLFALMNKIVKTISYTLIPIGILLLWARFRTEPDTTTAVTSTVAALINMIPEGLILLTSSVLALATIRLSKKNVLVQNLYSIETLARVDTICLDKTGTLTTGKMVVEDLIPAQGIEKNALQNALVAILSHSASDNATSTALKQKLLKTTKIPATSDFIEPIPFSSERKYSGIKTKNGEILMGALEFMTNNPKYLEEQKALNTTNRIIAVLQKNLHKDHNSETLLGFAILKDELRTSAPQIINYFYQNDIDVKIISGDNAATVTKIANTVGVKIPNAIDLSAQKGTINYTKLVQEYNIFARVKPSQKKHLISALKKRGKTVAMTGDGVNDILAMKEADCSIAIGEGSDAARRASQIVLLGSDFATVPAIIDEGRQSINNLERSTTLFLTKTVYAGLLAVIFVILPAPYPFNPIEMSLLNFACIGFPGFVLALEHNTARVKNLFISNIQRYSIPLGLSVVVVMVILSVFASIQGLSRAELTTISVLTVFILDFILIYRISRPLNLLRISLLVAISLVIILALSIPFVRNFFEFAPVTVELILASAILIAIGLALIFLLQKAIPHLLRKIKKVAHRRPF